MKFGQLEGLMFRGHYVFKSIERAINKENKEKLI